MNTFTGIVQKGKGRGAVLGYPTANIPLETKDVSGVYVAKVSVAGKEYNAVAFADQNRKLFEAHIFDFSGVLYGQTITITLLEKLRESKMFESDAELREEIARDVQKAKEYFQNK